jgi:hypothetical protein
MDSRAQPAPPAARKEGLLVEEIDDETVVYDLESKETHALSAPAAAVFAGSDGRRSLPELAEFAAERLQEPVTDDQVWEALVQLEERNLLKPPTGGTSGGTSRRGFVRTGTKVGAGIIAAPLITSLAMPSIASAISCVIGAKCGAVTDPGGVDCGKLMVANCGTGDCNTCKCVGTGASVPGYRTCGPTKDSCDGIQNVPLNTCGWV